MSRLKWNHIEYVFEVKRTDKREQYIHVCDYQDVGSMEFTLNETNGNKENQELICEFYCYEKGFEGYCKDKHTSRLFKEALEMIKLNKVRNSF